MFLAQAATTHLDGATGAGLALASLVFFVVAGIFGLALYFCPTIVAVVRKRSNVVAIAALNTLLGRSLIGWVVSLVWALSNDRPPATIIVNAGNQYPTVPPQGAEPQSFYQPPGSV